jgi:hypothetical protein
MAVDYFHRLLVAGPRFEVREFQRRMHREFSRTIAGQTWTEIVPFSFEALYELAPTVRSIEAEIPFDPYELSAWPVRNINGGRAEVRYQFQTRNLELFPFMAPLALALPALTFTLVTFCLDASSIEAHRLRRSRVQKWVLPDRHQELHWNRARRKFGLVGDEVYDDDDARRWAEEEMLHEALNHWDEAGRVRRGRLRRHEWWNAVPLRDLDTERKLSRLAIGIELEEKAKAKNRRKRRRVRARKRADGS